jgi:hypothetical protein
MNQPVARREDAGPSSLTFASGLSWMRVRTPRVLSQIGKVFFVLGGLGMLAMVTPGLEVLAVANVVGIFGWLLFIVSYVLSLTQTSFVGVLSISNDELVILSGTKRKAIPFAEIAGALVVQRPVAGGTVSTVEIELLNGDRLTARMPDPNAPGAVVRALGFGPGRRRVQATLSKPTRRLLHPLFGFASYVVGLTAVMMIGMAFKTGGHEFEVAFAAYPPVTLLLYALLQRYVSAAVVTVGDDGVAVRARGKTRVIARRDIAFAVDLTNNVALHLTTGMLAIEERSGARIIVGKYLVDHARVAAVASLVAERAGPSAGAGAERFAHYERAGRPLAAWRDHLGRAMNDASYRHNAATVDDAAAVLGSGEASAEQRIGAALALRVAGQSPERIRVAATSAVDDRVREALEAVADAENDVVIEKALQRMQR